MEPDDKDWASAACVDALLSGLSIETLQCAHDVANNPMQFFYAVEASIRVKDIQNAIKKNT